MNMVKDRQLGISQSELVIDTYHFVWLEVVRMT